MNSIVTQHQLTWELEERACPCDSPSHATTAPPFRCGEIWNSVCLMNNKTGSVCSEGEDGGGQNSSLSKYTEANAEHVCIKGTIDCANAINSQCPWTNLIKNKARANTNLKSAAGDEVWTWTCMNIPLLALNVMRKVWSMPTGPCVREI